MGIALLALAALQVPPSREMREGLERKYRVSVSQEGGDAFEYRLRVRVATPARPKGTKPKEGESLLLDLRLSDYRATLEDHRYTSPLVGGGQTPMQSNGLPQSLNVSGPQGPMWLPILSLYVPEKSDEGPFSVTPFAVAPGLGLTGTGTLVRDGKGSRVSLDASLVSAGKTLGKLTLATTIDAAGWPTKCEGALVSEDGTYRFTVARG